MTRRLAALGLLIGAVLAILFSPSLERVAQAVASYPTSVKSFTTRLTGDTIQASHVNDIQDEIVAIETALLGTITHAITISNAAPISLTHATTPEILATVGTLQLSANTSVRIEMDKDANGTETFTIVDGAAATVFTVAESGAITGINDLTLSGASSVLTFSGATAPEILFSGANGRIGSNTSLIFSIDVNADQTDRNFHFRTNGYTGTDLLQLSEAGLLLLNDSSNANMTAGLTINQAGADDQILALKSSDVASVITTATILQDVETDDFLTISKRTGATGGVAIQVLGEVGLASPLYFDIYGGPPDTDDTSASIAAANFFVAQHNGANALADMGANSNAFAWGEIDSGSNRLVRMLLKADDGELHLGNTTLVALDSDDDIMAVRSLQRARTEDRGIALTPFDPSDGRPVYSYQALRALGIVGEKDARGEFLIRVQPYLNLHDGAIWQLHVNHMRLKDTVAALERENRALRVRLDALERSPMQQARVQ